jgi:hypothetical protein
MNSKRSDRESLPPKSKASKSEKLIVSDQRSQREIERRTVERPEPGFNQRIAVNRGTNK